MEELTQNQSSKFDKKAIEDYGITKKELMQRAGEATAKILDDEILEKDQKILFLIGKGDNGADGLIAITELAKNHDVDILLYSKELATETSEILEEVKTRRFNEVEKVSDNYDVVIDCLIGFNLAGKPRKNLRKILKEVENLDARKISLDVPTGLETKQGTLHKTYFDANHIIMLGFAKKGISKHFDKADKYLADINYPKELYDEFGLEKTWNSLECS